MKNYILLTKILLISKILLGQTNDLQITNEMPSIIITTEIENFNGTGFSDTSDYLIQKSGPFLFTTYYDPYGLNNTSDFEGYDYGLWQSFDGSITEWTFEPYNDNTTLLGNPDYAWTEVWAHNGTIQTSDANVKENIKKSPYGLKEVLQMKPVTYNWKEPIDKNNIQNKKENIGFIAQDIMKILPQAIVKKNVSLGNSGLNINGKILPRKKSNAEYGMNYSELIPVLTKAIQEQQEIIEKMEKRIADLEAR